MGKFDFVSSAKRNVKVIGGDFTGKTGRTIKAFASATPGAPVQWSVAIDGYSGITFPIRSEYLEFINNETVEKTKTVSNKQTNALPPYIIRTITSTDLKPKY